MEELTRSVSVQTPRWLSLRFPDRAMERAFQARYAAESVARFRWQVCVVIAIWLSFGLLDHVAMEGADVTYARLIRFAFVTPVLVGVLALSWAPMPVFTRYWQPALSLGYAAIGGAMIFFFEIVSDINLRSSSTGGMALVIVGGYTLVNLRWVYAAATAALITTAVLIFYVSVHGADGVSVHAVDTGVVWIYLANLIGAIACRELERFSREKYLQSAVIERERHRAETLLRNILPASVADRLKSGQATIVDTFDSVTVLFGDLVGFTALAEKLPPRDLVDRLNDLYSEFDVIAESYGLEKIKTIGDAYMVVGGVPLPRDDHARAIASMALDMCDAVARRRAAGDDTLEIRIGIHTGPAVAGVIGTRKFSYDVWGDTVNIASRMQSHGVPGAVQVSETTCALLRGEFELEPRGRVALKGKAAMNAYLLLGRAAAGTSMRASVSP